MGTPFHINPDFLKNHVISQFHFIYMIIQLGLEKECLFRVTSQKNLGRVGTIFIFYFFLVIFYIEKPQIYAIKTRFFFYFLEILREIRFHQKI